MHFSAPQFSSVSSVQRVELIRRPAPPLPERRRMLAHWAGWTGGGAPDTVDYPSSLVQQQQ